MYIPKQFRETRADVILQALNDLRLGILVSAGEEAVEATHLPLLADYDTAGRLRLRGHVARANQQWRRLAGARALVIFQGPHAYISPSFYPSKHEHGKVVPTWNYLAIHVSGHATAIDDADWLRDVVGHLTEAQEAGRARPWAVGDAPEDYIAGMVKAIVGVEIIAENIEASWKFVQHRSEADRLGVIAGLSDANPEVADMMSALEKDRSGE
ncbi:MAG: FMN-binding negative transcriptional regulator [Hyphomicrobiales bacterium]|nr:FMN-binding negative transcriptional regulator [Hyphomicrobiales bacterium]